MKLCPRCHQEYADDTLNYCLNDGSALMPSADPSAETVIIPSRLISQTVPIARQGINPVFAVVAIGLLALVAGGAIVAFVMSRSAAQANIPTQQVTEDKKTTPGNAAASKPTTNNNVQVVKYPDSKPEPLTADAVRNLLNAWESAQETNNFRTYSACYDPSFIGVKISKDGVPQTLDYNAWMADRRQMIAKAVNLSIDLSDLQIKVEGDTATAQFDQYYRSLRYSDWGPKEITVKMTPAGAKIVREELKASNPL